MKRALFFSFFAVMALGQECSHLWIKDLAINPSGPKGFTGDTYAAYGLLGYENVPNLGWHVIGKFPRARFMSIETYITETKKKYDVHFDHQIGADPGSQNPFQEGAPMSTPQRDFHVDLIPRAGKSTLPNVIHVSPTEKVNSFYFRIYTPNENVTISDEDLPKVYAYNIETNEPMDCPKPFAALFVPNFPNALSYLVPAKKSFAFRSEKGSFLEKIGNNGQNSAIPSYQFGMNKVRHGRVVLLRFKAPTFFNSFPGTGPFQTNGDVRYWSICTQNVAKGQTLNCLPDYLAKVDSQGDVTIALGKGEDVRLEAERRGYSFLEDKRAPNQPVMQFIYRNILPTADFEKNSMYQGVYNPTGVVCTKKAFLAGDC